MTANTIRWHGRVRSFFCGIVAFALAVAPMAAEAGMTWFMGQKTQMSVAASHSIHDHSTTVGPSHSTSSGVDADHADVVMGDDMETAPGFGIHGADASCCSAFCHSTLATLIIPAIADPSVSPELASRRHRLGAGVDPEQPQRPPSLAQRA